MKETPSYYFLFPEQDQWEKTLHWEKHPHNEKIHTIIGETIPVIEDYHGVPIGGNRWVVEYEGNITDLSKRWF